MVAELLVQSVHFCQYAHMIQYVPMMQHVQLTQCVPMMLYVQLIQCVLVRVLNLAPHVTTAIASVFGSSRTRAAELLIQCMRFLSACTYDSACAYDVARTSDSVCVLAACVLKHRAPYSV